MYTSQLFGNIYLNEIDKLIRVNKNSKVKIDYVRYADDMIVFGDKNNLNTLLTTIKHKTKELSLQLNPLTGISKIIPNKYISFVGYRYKRVSNNKILQTLNKKTLRKIKKFSNNKKKMPSLFGWIKNTNNYNFIKQLTYKNRYSFMLLYVIKSKTKTINKLKQQRQISKNDFIAVLTQKGFKFSSGKTVKKIL